MATGSMGKAVLIGGGITSALTAVRLAERGFEIIVLEKGAVGNGSSSRAAGGIRAQFRSVDTVIAMMYAKAWYEHQFHNALRVADETKAIQQNGYLFLYENPEQSVPWWRGEIRKEVGQQWAQAQQYATMQQNLGLPVVILSPAEIRARWPNIAVDQLIGATWCETDGLLFPEVVFNEGFRYAREIGVRILEGTEVLGATHRSGRIANVETTEGPIEADWFINCTNAWGPRLSRSLAGMELAVSPEKRYTYWLAPTETGMEPNDFDALPMTIYGQGGGRGSLTRPAEGLLKMLWAHHTEPEPNFTDEDQDSQAPGFSHKDGRNNFGREVFREIQGFWPALKGRITRTTCGYYGTTPDASPLIGVDNFQGNLVHAVGFSGHGAMHAPTTAVLLEAILCQEVPNLQVSLPAPFSDQRIWLGAFAPDREFSETVDVIL